MSISRIFLFSIITSVTFLGCYGLIKLGQEHTVRLHAEEKEVRSRLRIEQIKFCLIYRDWQGAWVAAWKRKLVEQKGELSDAEFALLVDGNKVQSIEEKCL